MDYFILLLPMQQKEGIQNETEENLTFSLSSPLGSVVHKEMLLVDLKLKG